jgi:hypothetical protein
MKRTFLTVTFSLIVSLAISPRTASAFSYEEHCRISNHALLLAVGRLHTLHRKMITREQESVLRGLVAAVGASNCKDAARVSSAYGDLVARVDWALSPADYFLAQAQDQAVARTDTAPLAAVAALQRLPLQDLRLLKENREHFGARAMFAFRTWHQVAIGEAASTSGRVLESATGWSPGAAAIATTALQLALTYNAFADHYLEDLFAPGHVFSVRAAGDELAGGIHDWYNRRGAYYYPVDAHDLSDFVDTDLTLDQVALLSRFDATLDGICGAVPASVSAASFRRRCVEQLAVSPILMYGDKMLSQSPKQELWVTLVIARSVEDVLETWLAGAMSHSVDSFRDPLQWCGYRRVSIEHGVVFWDSPTARTRFGEFLVERGGGAPNFVRWPTLRAGYQSTIGARGDFITLSVERRLATSLGEEWLGPGDEPSAATDKSTFTGYDARIPTSRDVSGPMIGYFRRWVKSYGRIDARLSGIAGTRVGGFWTGVAGTAVEAHVGPAIELGFGLAQLELRPEATWRPFQAGRSDWTSPVRVSLLSALVVTVPRSFGGRKGSPVVTPSRIPGAACMVNRFDMP